MTDKVYVGQKRVENGSKDILEVTKVLDDSIKYKWILVGGRTVNYMESSATLQSAITYSRPLTKLEEVLW